MKAEARVKRIGLCHKCYHALTIPAMSRVTQRVVGAEIVGCKIEKEPKAGENCPLVRDLKSA